MVLLATHKKGQFKTGDIVRVHQKIQDDNKTRTQIFEGTVIAIGGHGFGKSFTVRRIGASGVGIERIFPLFSPLVERVEVKNPGFVRRSKIYFIRDKSAREIAEITRPRGKKVKGKNDGFKKPSSKIKTKAKHKKKK